MFTSQNRSLTCDSDIGVITIQLRYTSTLNSIDATLDMWPWVIVTQAVQCVITIASFIPYFRPVLKSIPSGMYMGVGDELRRRGISDPGSTGESIKRLSGVLNVKKLLMKTDNRAVKAWACPPTARQ